MHLVGPLSEKGDAKRGSGGRYATIAPSLFSSPNGLAWCPKRFATDWDFHEAVVKNGLMYDAMTCPSGSTIREYKEIWEYASDIQFGF